MLYNASSSPSADTLKKPGKSRVFLWVEAGASYIFTNRLRLLIYNGTTSGAGQPGVESDPPALLGQKSMEVRMKLSARNQIKGTIVEVVKGQTTAHVKINIGGGIITSSITNAAVDDLGLKAGDTAYAVIKASDVMIGK